MIDWFTVSFDEDTIGLTVEPPGRDPWVARIPWLSIDRVCFEADFPASDSIYLFTNLRPESWVIPTEGIGGGVLLDELIRRGLFDAEVAIEAASAESGLFCWPPLSPPT